MAKHRRRKQKNRDRATGKKNPVHHEAAPRAAQRPTADAPPAPEQPTTVASPTSAAQNPEPPQAHQPTRQADPHAEPAITDPEPTARAPARCRGSMVEVNDKPDWEVTPYRPPTVTRAKTRMQLGEWEQLAELDGNEVIGGASVTELQLMAAVGHLQKGGESARDRARTLLLEAMDAGADRKQIARMLIAGASNTLGRLAALTGRSDQKVLEHFRSALLISDPDADVDLMLHPMAARQLMRLARKTGSKSIQEMAQRTALSMAFCEAGTAAPAHHEPPGRTGTLQPRYKELKSGMRSKNSPLIELIKDLPSNLVMAEVGCYAGESSLMFLESGKIQEFHAIDVWRSDWQPYPDETRPNNAKNKNSIYAQMDWAFWSFCERVKGYNVKIYKKTLDDALNELPSLDFIYIDADHSYTGVINDIMNAKTVLKPDGIIAGHDYNHSYKGVIKAVNQVFGKPDKVYMDSSWIIFPK